jgi:hypothetical protein
MFFKKRQPTEIEKTKIILNYLNEELTILCQNTDPIDQDTISIRIYQIQKMITEQTQTLKQLQWK